MAKRKPIEYALYKGDKFLVLGTKEELAEYLGVKVDTITYYGSNAYQRKGKNDTNERYIVIKVEDIE